MNSVRFATLLICFAVPFGSTHGQSTTAPITVSESKQFVIKPNQGSATTHIPSATHYTHPERPDKPDPPDDRDDRDDEKPRSPPQDDPGGDSGSPGTRTGTPSPAEPGPPAPVPMPENTPSARDLANRGGSLLQRSPAGFATLPESFSEDLDGQNDDPDAEYEPCELLTLSTTMSEAQALEQQFLDGDIRIRRRIALPNLNVVLSSFCVADYQKAETALQSLGEQQPALPVALNHRYQLAANRDYYAEVTGWREDLRSCGISRRIGLIDTTVDTQHQMLRESSVTTKDLLSPGTRSAGPEHGTAVASVLVGAGETPGLVGRAELAAVNVFRLRDGDIIDTNAELLVRGIDWLLGQGVELINMSIAGPPNAVLEFAVNAVFNSGILVVAAGGNGDRNPAFPAAYPDVIAVTAVDARSRVHAATNQGDYIDFAAPGVDLYLAAPDNRGKYYTGTSFATPFVTAALAAMKTAYPGADNTLLIRELSSRAVDLGTAGRDPVFGWGLVQAPVECTSVAARE